MKKLYQDRITINDVYSMQIDPNDEDNLLLFKYNQVVMHFALNRKIYTLFKVLQDLIQSDQYLTIENNKGDLYSAEIPLKDDIYMKINNVYACLTIDLYTKSSESNYELIYLTFLTYTAKTLFQKLRIPYDMKVQKNYKVRNIFKFLDMIMIINYTQEIKRKVME